MHAVFAGAEGVWWPHRSSKPAGPANPRVGGFDSHTLPPPWLHLLLPRDLHVLRVVPLLPVVFLLTRYRPQVVAAGVLAMGCLASVGLGAQVVPDSVSVAPDSVVASPDSVSVAGSVAAGERPGYDEFAGRPRGAFLRALAIPGWGHAAIGAHGRGGVYMGTQAVVTWMLLRTRSGINGARDLVAVRSAAIERELLAAGVDDPAQIESALEGDEGVARARGLEAARQQQFEDWLALGIFTLFLSGADAFVSAHLQTFPADVTVVPVGDEGRVDVGLRVPVGGR